MASTIGKNSAGTIGLLTAGFGLVGFDRFMIMPMFPILQKDLGLSYQDLGLVTGSLAISWGFCSIFAGSLGDRIGVRKVVVGSLVLFSLLAGLSGLATGLITLVLIRIIMGAFEGAFTPAALIATLTESHPAHRGRNIGVLQAAMPFFGLALAPIIITQLLHVIDWRWIFAIVTLPGLLVAHGLFKRLKPKPVTDVALETLAHDTSPHAWRDLFVYRNIPLNIVGMFCWLNCLIVLTAMLPSYLISYLHFSLTQMGWILSAIGFGATAGDLIMLWLSDYIGRRTAALIDALATAVCLVLFVMAGHNAAYLFATLFGAAFFLHNLMALTMGPLSAEAVPVRLMASASGLVIGVGEIFGGGVAPILAGMVAQKWGIQYTLNMAIAGLAIGFIALLAVKETRPSTHAPA